MRTIIAVVSPADALDIEVNVQLFSDDNRVYAPVFRLAKGTNDAQRAAMENKILDAAYETFHVGQCHGYREVYTSPNQTIQIFEIDFDSMLLTENTALKYRRI